MTLRDPFSGLSHAVGLALAIFGAGWLLARMPAFSIAIYAACLVTLYAASSVYHLLPASKRLRAFDHAAIFALVAGTSTPVLAHGLTGTRRLVMLGFLWTVAFAGVVAKLSWQGSPRWLSTVTYVAMGWSVVAVAPALLSALPLACVACVIAGGVVYTLGALVYATKWPNPKPPLFGFHEIWHLFVLAGSALHFAAIALLA